MKDFKPGEKAKLVEVPPIDPFTRQYMGTEVTVMGGPEPTRRLLGGCGYIVKCHDGTELMCTPECLERPQPPKEQVGNWEDVPYWKQITAPKMNPVEHAAGGLAFGG